MQPIKSVRLLFAITVLASIGRGQLDICESYVPVSETGSGTADGVFSITAYLIELVTINALFADIGGYSGALVGLDFSLTHTWGSVCAECNWSLQAL